MVIQEPFPLRIDHESQMVISTASQAAVERRSTWKKGFEELDMADTLIRSASDGKLSLFDEINKPATTDGITQTYFVIIDPTYQRDSPLSVQRIILFPNINGETIEITQNAQDTANGAISLTRRPFKPGEDDKLVQMVLDRKLEYILPKLPTISTTFPLLVPAKTAG